MKVSSLVGTSTFTYRVEKHLDDRRKGRGQVADSIPDELASLNNASAISLGHSDPKALLNYNTYRTAFTYDQNARFVRDVGSVISTNNTLQSLAKKLEQIKDAQLNADTSPKQEQVNSATQTDSPPRALSE